MDEGKNAIVGAIMIEVIPLIEAWKNKVCL
jgi:hypothetical protein